jgi:hypothetical protein
MRPPYTSTGNAELSSGSNFFAILKGCEACNAKNSAFFGFFPISAVPNSFHYFFFHHNSYKL